MLQQASPRTCHSCPRQQTAAAQHAILYRFHALGHIATSLLMREHTRGQNDLLAPARPSWLLRGRAMGAAPSLQCARARESDAAMQDTRGKHLGMRLFIVVFAAVGLRSVGHGRLHRSCTPLGISEPRTDVTRRRGSGGGGSPHGNAARALTTRRTSAAQTRGNGAADTSGTWGDQLGDPPPCDRCRAHDPSPPDAGPAVSPLPRSARRSGFELKMWCVG
jgi:hypothetical protein